MKQHKLLRILSLTFALLTCLGLAKGAAGVPVDKVNDIGAKRAANAGFYFSAGISFARVRAELTHSAENDEDLRAGSLLTQLDFLSALLGETAEKNGINDIRKSIENGSCTAGDVGIFLAELEESFFADSVPDEEWHFFFAEAAFNSLAEREESPDGNLDAVRALAEVAPEELEYRVASIIAQLKELSPDDVLDEDQKTDLLNQIRAIIG